MMSETAFRVRKHDRPYTRLILSDSPEGAISILTGHTGWRMASMDVDWEYEVSWDMGDEYHCAYYHKTRGSIE